MFAQDMRRRAGVVVARSLSQVVAMASEGVAVASLSLPGSSDFVCRNIMCGQVGLACACRLALVLSKHGAELEELDISHNGLSTLPTEAMIGLQRLRALDLAGNPIPASSIVATVTAMPALRRLRLTAGQLSQSSMENLRGCLPALQVELDDCPSSESC
jgi:Leucine-rich repeat (LRR) protein